MQAYNAIRDQLKQERDAAIAQAYDAYDAACLREIKPLIPQIQDELLCRYVRIFSKYPYLRELFQEIGIDGCIKLIQEYDWREDYATFIHFYPHLGKWITDEQRYNHLSFYLLSEVSSIHLSSGLPSEVLCDYITREKYDAKVETLQASDARNEESQI